MGRSRLVEWAAFYLMEATEQDPELTEWDDEATVKRKTARRAARNLRGT